MLKQCKNKFLGELVSVALLVATLHYLALSMSLYWTVEWFDILMHFLGGATMAFLSLYIFFTSNFLPSISKLKDHRMAVFLIVVFFTLVVGSLWELWEIFFGMSDVMKDKLDTIIDLIMDTLGAVCVYYYAIRKMNNE
jgi:hypothetical protein